MSLSKKHFFKCIDFETERDWTQREREGERERIPSRLHTIRAKPHVGLELTNREIVS